jgi:protein-disulfide isomerase
MHSKLKLAFTATVALVWTGCQPSSPASSASSRTSNGVSGPVQSFRPADLTPREARDWEAYLNRFPSPCAEPAVTLAECLEQPAGCRACPAASRFVAGSIRAGHVAAQVEARYTARFDPAQVRVIDVAGEPFQGPRNAAVTLVEFADFECPFCASVVPVVDSLVKSYEPHLRVVFKVFPIEYHQHAELTAHAGVAAHQQGKFWELHHLMFANRTQLEAEDIDRYARSLNLDMTRFARDRDSALVAQRVKASYNEGERLNVHGTPSFFINGRAFDFDLFDFGGEDMLDWIELEIELVTGKRPVRTGSVDGADEGHWVAAQTGRSTR